MTNTRLQMRRAGDGAWEISLYGDIGSGGITAEDVRAKLAATPAGTRTIRVRINSHGGDIFASFAVYNMLRSRREWVQVAIDGVAASAASLIAMAGDEIVIAENAFMMLHAPVLYPNSAVGEAKLREYADLIANMSGKIASIYSERSGQDVGRIVRMLSGEFWMNADEAVALGFADRITPASQIAAKLDLSRFPNAPAAIAVASLPENQTPAGLAVADFRAADATRAKMGNLAKDYWMKRNRKESER